MSNLNRSQESRGKTRDHGMNCMAVSADPNERNSGMVEKDLDWKGWEENIQNSLKKFFC